MTKEQRLAGYLVQNPSALEVLAAGQRVQCVLDFGRMTNQSEGVVVGRSGWSDMPNIEHTLYDVDFDNGVKCACSWFQLKPI